MIRIGILKPGKPSELLPEQDVAFWRKKLISLGILNPKGRIKIAQ